jgi:hypothetical protein
MKKRRLQDMKVWSVVILVTGLIGLLDWKTGYELNFFAFYFLPIGLSAWYLGAGETIILAVASAVVWFLANAQQPYSSPIFATWNTIIRLISFLAFGWTLASLKRSLDHERETAEDLRKSLSEIKVLEALLPICAQCKKIRNQQGVWQIPEMYIGEHSNTQFSHSYCPECARKVLTDAGMDGGKTG